MDNKYVATYTCSFLLTAMDKASVTSGSGSDTDGTGLDAADGRGGALGGGGGTGIALSSLGSAATAATLPAPAAAPKVVLLLEILGGVHFEPVDAGDIGLKEAALLRSSSSSCCFFARACRSLQVSFFEPLGVAFGGCGDCWSDCCAIFSNGFTSFFGRGKFTGV